MCRETRRCHNRMFTWYVHKNRFPRTQRYARSDLVVSTGVIPEPKILKIPSNGIIQHPCLYGLLAQLRHKPPHLRIEWLAIVLLRLGAT